MAVGAKQQEDALALRPRSIPVGRVLRRGLAWAQTATLPMLVVILACYLTPRLTDLNREVTADEPLWLGRSANFYEALAHGDFSNTYQAAHPGVTTMWAGTAGFITVFRDYPAVYPRQFSPDRNSDLLLRKLHHDPLAVLIACRIAKILLQTACFTVAFLFARRVFGDGIALVTAVLMAGDPFLIAHDRLLHIDGLFTITAFTSLLALLAAIRTEERVNRRDIALAGFFAALAWLTRITGAALLIFTVVVLAIDAWRRAEGESRRWRAAAQRVWLPLLLWGGTAAIVTFTLWPALWVDPLACLNRIVAYSLAAAAEGHEYGIFFAGRTYVGDPGALYYPVALIWRATPVVLAGVAITLIAALARARGALPVRFPMAAAITGCYVTMWLLLMSDGAKKFDRYVLTVFPALDLLAAIGFVGLVRWACTQRKRLIRQLPTLVLGAALLSQALSAAMSAPYYLTYFNPALGGTTGASRELPLGWGEGLDQATGFILRQPAGATATVRASVVRGSWAMFFPPTVSARGNGFRARMSGVLDWYDTDYYISYVSQWQRDTNPDLLSQHLAHYQPIYTVRLKNQDFVKVYDLRTIPPPSYMIDQQPCAFTFADQVQLVAYRDLGASFHGLRGGQYLRQLQLLFTTGAGAKAADTVDVTLLSPEIVGQDEALSQSVRLTPVAGQGMLSAVQVGLPLPPGKTFSDYHVIITLHDAATGQAIPGTNLLDHRTASGVLLPHCD